MPHGEQRAKRAFVEPRGVGRRGLAARAIFALLSLTLLAACATQAPQSGLRLVYRLEGDPAQLPNAIEVLRNRVAEAGDSYTVVEPIAPDRIEVRRPGLAGSGGIGDYLTRRGALSFNLVDVANPADYQVGVARSGRIALPDDASNGQSTVIFTDPILTNSAIADADQTLDERGRAAISVKLDPAGATRFGAATSENVGRPIAIVLDNRILSAPTITAPITGGNLQITGEFTVAEADEIARVLRSGALPAPLTLIERSLYGERF